MREPSPPVAYGAFDDAFIDQLANRFQGSRILEIFAGNGLLASKLYGRGIDIVATSLFAGHDGHDRGFQYPVIEMEAVRAVCELGPECDVLLMSWPTTTEAAFHAIAKWGSGRPVIYIGEAPRADLHMGGLPGCASDDFFAVIDEIDSLESYEPRNILERAMVIEVNDEKLLRVHQDHASRRNAFDF